MCFLRESPLGDGKGLSYSIFVNGGNVPYYNNVVNNPTITYARHYGRSEYGNVRYSNSKEITKNNRNYKYYKDGNQYVMNLMTKYNGKSYKVTDSIGGYKKMILEKVIRNYIETTLNGLCANANFDFLFEGKVSFNDFKPHRKLNGKMAIPFMVEQELSQNLNDGFNSIRYVFTIHLLPYADIREKIEELQYYLNQIFNGIQSLEIDDYKLSISLNGYNFGVDETNGFYDGLKSFAWNISLIVDSSNEALTSSDIEPKIRCFLFLTKEKKIT